MSYFKSKGIVLKKTKYGEKEFLYSIFSYDFGKIDVIKKKGSKEKPLDIGYDINFEVHSQKNSKLSRVANIKITAEFDTSKHGFSTINDFLSLIFEVYSKTEKNIAIYEIYNLLHETHKIEISAEKLLFARLKLKDIFGVLSSEDSDPTIQKILQYIISNSPKNCLRLKDLSKEQIERLEKIVST